MNLFRLSLRAFPGVLRSGFQLLPRTNSVALATTRLALPRSPPALKAALRALDAAVSHRYLIGISSVSHRYLIGGNCTGTSPLYHYILLPPSGTSFPLYTTPPPRGLHSLPLAWAENSKPPYCRSCVNLGSFFVLSQGRLARHRL